MQPLLNIAVRAARRAGDIIVRAMPRLESVEIHTKGRNDYVTEVDRAAEADIIETVRRLHPTTPSWARKAARRATTTWSGSSIPLDGTTNFLHGFPTFAVSIGVQVRGRMEHAVVFDPMRQELFTASRGDGAQLDGRRIRVSKQATLEGSLIATGFPFRADSPWVDEYLAMLTRSMIEGRRACAGRAPPRWTWPIWPRAASTASGNWASSPGTPRLARC